MFDRYLFVSIRLAFTDIHVYTIIAANMPCRVVVHSLSLPRGTARGESYPEDYSKMEPVDGLAALFTSFLLGVA
jgi:hypothetical protein